jgi:acetyltransferase
MGEQTIKTKDALDLIFNPNSVAVIGASEDPFKWGHMLLAAIMKGGYQGDIYPVNPRTEEILGLRCFKKITDIPGKVDAALVVVPAYVVPNVFQDIAEKGVKGTVVITSGFSETGEEGRKQIQKIKEIARNKTRFIGPNCMGVTSSKAKLSALMIPFLHELGDVAFISQSGGYGLQLYLRAENMGVGIGKFVSSGNESDLKSWEYLKYLGEDVDTKIICMYIEGLTNGRKWYQEARKITPVKPIVVIKVGVTDVGSRTAVSHTGSIAGSDKIYDAAFKQAGVIRAKDAGEMFDYVKALQYCSLPKGPNIGVVSNSGGVAVETADRLIQNGLKVPILSTEAQREILENIPPFGNPRNPVDLTATLDMRSFLTVPGIVLKQEEIDGMITISLGTSLITTMFPEVGEEDLQGMIKWINNQLIDTYKKHEKPVIVIEPSAETRNESVQQLEEAGIPVYGIPGRAADSMAILWKRKQYLMKADACF